MDEAVLQLNSFGSYAICEMIMLSGHTSMLLHKCKNNGSQNGEYIYLFQSLM